MTSTTPEHEISTETQEMTDAEAIETLVRTDEEHLTEFDDDGNRLTPAEAVEPPVLVLPPLTPGLVAEQVEVDGSIGEGVKVVRTQGTSPQMFHILSEIGEGVYVAWDFCRRDGKPISQCTCKQGPEEPKYVTQWRLDFRAARAKEFKKTMAAASERVTEELRETIKRAVADQTLVPTTVDTAADSEEETPA